MADTIRPTTPVKPTLPVNVDTDKGKQQKRRPATSNQSKKDTESDKHADNHTHIDTYI